MEFLKNFFGNSFSYNETVLLVIIGLFALIVLLAYILSSIGLMKMSKNLNEKGGWMAWLPIVNSYLLGKTAFTKALGWTMLIITLLTGTVYYSINGLVTFSLSLPKSLSTILMIILIVLSLISIFKLYKLFSKKYIVMIVFTILSFGLLSPIFIFSIRNNKLNIN